MITIGRTWSFCRTSHTGCHVDRTRTIRYFDIAWRSRYDGPGQRVVVFLQGCSLRCPWCHSPHSRESESPLLFFAARCCRCGRCEAICPQSVHRIGAASHELRRERCRRCGKCVEACLLSSRDRLSGALALPTRELTIGELWELLYPQLDVLRAIGGMTVSGGEPLLQSQSLRELFHLCHASDIHTAVETCGAVPLRCIEDVIGLVDCWLFGLRPTPDFVPQVEDNLAALTARGSRVIVRTPIIAGITDLPISLDKIAKTMQTRRLREIELLPCHEGVSHYYDASGKQCPLGSEAIPSVERLDAVREYFEQCGCVVRIVR